MLSNDNSQEKGRHTSQTKHASGSGTAQCWIPEILLASQGSRRSLCECKNPANCTKCQRIISHNPSGLSQGRQCHIPLHHWHILPRRSDGSQYPSRKKTGARSAERLECDGVILSQVPKFIRIQVGILVALHDDGLNLLLYLQSLFPIQKCAGRRSIKWEEMSREEMMQQCDWLLRYCDRVPPKIPNSSSESSKRRAPTKTNLRTLGFSLSLSVSLWTKERWTDRWMILSLWMTTHFSNFHMYFDS